MGFLGSFPNNYLKHNQRRHVKMDYNESSAKQLKAARQRYEFRAHPLRNANMMGSTYILVQLKDLTRPKMFFGKA